MRWPLGILLIAMTACHSGQDASITLFNGESRVLTYAETLSTAIVSEPPKIDWALSSDTDSSWIEEHIMEGLVRFDLTKPGLQLNPALATDWSTPDNGKTWIFNLRNNVKWTDGVIFNSAHVLEGYEYIMNPASAAIAVDNTFPIKNAKEYNSGKIKDFNKVGVKANGDWQIIYTLESPMAFFPMLLAHHTHFPIRKDIIRKHKELWTEPENIVTLGPYKLIHWHHDSRLVLERNENYWGPKPKIKFVNFYMIEKDATKLRMFERGKLDFIRELPSSEIQRLKKKPEFHFLPGLRLYYYGFKVNKKPLDDVNVRKAIAHAIDKNEIVKVLGGGQAPLKSWIPTGMFGFDDTVGLEFNVEKAKDLLKAYDLSKFPTLTLGFNTDEKHKRVAENVQAQLKKNLGIKIELKNEEWKTFLNGLRSDSAYDIFRLGWVADYGDPHNFFQILVSYSENNRTGWKSLKYDELVRKGLQEPNQEERLKIYKQAQKIIVENEMPVIPILTDVNQLLVSKRVKNYHNNVLDLYYFHTMELEP